MSLLHLAGDGAAVLLAASLACTPLRRWTGRPKIMRWRRGLGLAAFSLATVHGALVFLQADAWQDLLENPYRWAGTVAWLILLSLALTSTRASQKRLGKNWKKLHRLVYAAALLGAAHLLLSGEDELAVYILPPLLGLVLLTRLPSLR